MGILQGRSHVPVTAEDYQLLAHRRLPRFLRDYIDGGAGGEDSMAANEDDFQLLSLRQRVMRDVSRVDTATELCGRSVSMPVALAPIGMAGMMARRGEVLGARAAANVGVPFTPSTVDLAVTGMRHRDAQSGMLGGAPLAKAMQLLTRPRWLLDVGIRGKPHSFGHLSDLVADPNDLGAYKDFVDSQFDPSVTWTDIEWLRARWQGRLIIKGLMSDEDARAAAGAGADGVVVSNHGGRQLDGVSSTIRKLPEVAAAVGERLDVLLDGGIRCGTDVVKAVALGADGVLIGRPWVWAVAARGEQGLRDYLSVMQQEIAATMALMGVNRIEELNPELLEMDQGIC